MHYRLSVGVGASKPGWMSCADVTIVKALEGPAIKPFTVTDDCDVCCGGRVVVCANWTSCLNDKTGDCAHCWNVSQGYNPTYASDIHCLMAARRSGILVKTPLVVGHQVAQGAGKKTHGRASNAPTCGCSSVCLILDMKTCQSNSSRLLLGELNCSF